MSLRFATTRIASWICISRPAEVLVPVPEERHACEDEACERDQKDDPENREWEDDGVIERVAAAEGCVGVHSCCWQLILY